MSFYCIPSEFILPDLISDCVYPYYVNPHCFGVARASEQWLINGVGHTTKRREAFLGLKAGELTAACYPYADAFHLRVCVDFMNWLFTSDDWLDELGVDDAGGMAYCCLSCMRDPHTFETDKAAGKLVKSFFGRFVQDAGPGCTERFITTMSLFYTAVTQQAADRARGVIPDLESYIPVRRDTSGCKPCFALIEYAAGIDLPDEVACHPIIRNMEEATNDLVTWSNDIFSWNVEQARNDTHNMVPVLMRQRGLSMQEAVDFIGDFCKSSIERFEADRRSLPSWGQDIDHDVAKYVEGLQNWIIGSLHWSFETERYFGKEGLEIEKHRIIRLLPKVPSHRGAL